MNDIFSFLKRNMRYTVPVALLVFVGFIALFYFLISGESGITQNQQQATSTAQVKVASVAALAQESASLTLVGTVRSSSEAELRAEAGGQVTGVYVTAGQRVGAGTILAETENSAQRAGVLSAKGALDATKAGLAKLLAGARPEDRQSATAAKESAQTSLTQSRVAAVNAFTQGYASAQDAMFAKTDMFFSDPLTVRPHFRISTADYDESLALESERVAIGDELATWQKDVQIINTSNDVTEALSHAQMRLERINRFLNTISRYVNEQRTSQAGKTVEQIAAEQGVATAALSEIHGALSAVTGAQQAIAGAQSGAVAAESITQKIASGAQREDIELAQASVTQAQGAYNAALAGLEKTRVRAPIGGTVSTISVRKGDFIAPQTSVAVVSNKTGLEVETSVTEDAKNRIAVGNEALIDGIYKGVVTSIEPGLDPVTKKSRVRIGLSSATDLTSGQFVEVVITEKVQTVKQRDGFNIPITSIKVLPDSFVIFTVSASSTLVAHKIQEGTIIGDAMRIKEGLTPDMKIVLDARGRNEGETVQVQE